MKQLTLKINKNSDLKKLMRAIKTFDAITNVVMNGIEISKKNKKWTIDGKIISEKNLNIFIDENSTISNNGLSSEQVAQIIDELKK